MELGTAEQWERDGKKNQLSVMLKRGTVGEKKVLGLTVDRLTVGCWQPARERESSRCWLSSVVPGAMIILVGVGVVVVVVVQLLELLL